MPTFKSNSKSSSKSDPNSKPGFKLVGSDKQSKRDQRQTKEPDTPKTLHFPEHTPWGDRKDETEEPSDILDSIDRQIDKAQEALGRLEEDADVLFKITDDDDTDDDTPAAA